MYIYVHEYLVYVSPRFTQFRHHWGIGCDERTCIWLHLSDSITIFPILVTLKHHKYIAMYLHVHGCMYVIQVQMHDMYSTSWDVL